MRVLHVITSLNIGGAEKLMVDLLPRLKAAGVEIELLLFVGNRTMFYEELEREDIKIHVFSKTGNVYNPKHIVSLYRFLRKNKFDIIHTHNTAPQIFAAIVSHILPYKLITTEHSTDNRRRNWKWYKLVDKWMYSRYDRVISISDAAQINLKSYLSINDSNSKYHVVYNGVDTEKFISADGCHNRVEEKTIVTMVAGFRYQKDQDTLIRAFTLLPKDKYELWLVGDGERRKELENLISSENLKDNIKLLGIRQDVPSILKSSDIIVMSSHFEGLSLSNIEGMSAGKPFIASDVDGLYEITQGAGLLFKHGDYKNLASLITDLANNKELYKEVAAKCMKRALQYDISKMVDGYIKVYQSILS